MAGPITEEEKSTFGYTPIKQTNLDQTSKQMWEMFSHSNAKFKFAMVNFTFDQAVDFIKKQPNPELKTSMFLNLISQASELYRVNKHQINSFGFKYDASEADATTIVKSKTGNCLSFNLSFLSFAMKAAEEVNIKATGALREVARVSNSDYTGHVIGSLKIQNQPTFFFDMTNASDYDYRGFRQDKEDPNILYGFGDYKYELGVSIQPDNLVFEATRIQQKLANKIPLTKSDERTLLLVQPIMLTYLLNSLALDSKSNMSEIAQNIWENKTIHDPNVLLRLSLTLSEYFIDSGDKTAALEFAKLASQSLKTMVSSGRTKELRLTPYLSAFSKCFELLMANDDPAAFPLYRAVNVTLGMAETRDLVKDVKDMSIQDKREFFKSVYSSFKTAKADINYNLEVKDAVKAKLIESLSFIKVLDMISDLELENDREIKIIAKGINGMLVQNYSALGLDYDKLAVPRNDMGFELIKAPKSKLISVSLYKRTMGLYNMVTGTKNEEFVFMSRENISDFLVGAANPRTPILKFI